MKGLADAIRYDPLTGKLFWLDGQRRAGKEAGTLHKGTGYLTLRFCGKFLYAHRVAWYLTHSTWPDFIDHDNRIRSDNRLTNLVDGTKRKNHLNMGKFLTNTSGHTGVYWSAEISKWVASITLNSKLHHLGCFENKAEAICSRKAAEKLHGFHANHGT